MPEYRHTKTGRIVNSISGMGYPWVEVGAPSTEFAARTAEAILAEVGDDPLLAEAALEAEKERETPRKVLTANLQKIIRDAEDE